MLNVASWATPAGRVTARYLEAKGTGRGWETRRENDEFVEQNIPEELLLLWRKVKGQFKGDPHSRYEAFMEWVEENPDANAQIQMEHAEKKLRKDLREMKREQLCRERCPSCYSGERAREDAPF
jgi:hypothetical protein